MHSLPGLEQAQVSTQRTRMGRWTMMAVLLVCAAPVVVSYITYYMVRPDAISAFGTLIDPQRPLPDLRATALDGSSVDLRSLKGQWLLLSVAGGECDDRCKQHLYLQRQMRESLGKEKDRVDRVWLINDDAAVPDALLPAVHDATVLRVAPQALAQWLWAAPGQPLDAHLYLVDPLGNWMMRFPAGLDLAGAVKAKRDIGRVLRASAFWDRAGR